MHFTVKDVRVVEGNECVKDDAIIKEKPRKRHDGVSRIGNEDKVGVFMANTAVLPIELAIFRYARKTSRVGTTFEYMPSVFSESLHEHAVTRIARVIDAEEAGALGGGSHDSLMSPILRPSVRMCCTRATLECSLIIRSYSAAPSHAAYSSLRKTAMR